MTKLPELMHALSSLSAKDLKVVRSEVERLLAGYSKVDEPLYRAVQQVLGADMPLSQFERSTYLKHWIKNQGKVLDFLEQWTSHFKKTRGEDYRLKVYLMSLIHRYLVEIKITPSIGTMTLQMSAIAWHFDNAFPGYWINGMASSVANNVLKRKEIHCS